MLRHFEKLNSTLRSVLRFPSLEDQRRRFLSAGWQDVQVRSLWSLWSDDEFLSTAERLAVDKIEPFDEVEEFALFASHYFLLLARTKPLQHLAERTVVGNPHYPANQDEMPANKLAIVYSPYPKGQGYRRFGAAYSADGYNVYNHGGHGTQGRLKTSDLYAAEARSDSSSRLSLIHI